MDRAELVKRILFYIEENPDKILTWEKLAQELNYSKFYMARVFKEHTGITLCKYMQGRRLEIAADKLIRTGLPVIEIAFEAGYGSQQAFTRAFRHEYGCTPQEYRKKGGAVLKHDGISMSAASRKTILAVCCRKGKEEWKGGRMAA